MAIALELVEIAEQAKAEILQFIIAGTTGGTGYIPSADNRGGKQSCKYASSPSKTCVSSYEFNSKVNLHPNYLPSHRLISFNLTGNKQPISLSNQSIKNELN
ncbi:MAG: hypothetical protein H0W47_12420 [Polaromonas sp.]|uniref:hypothetical protein n=1 Tax=Polaromonas sp. TaxID=1869339 RepID=UPI001834176F|nr:hypothetical protein [Polaromonas sp.]MBA3594584.1 hypothetical protein [Polaromonas sp.]